MKIQKVWAIGVLSFVVVAISLVNAVASTIFIDNFEGDLSQWIGQYGGVHHGVVISDPLVSGNHVLTFTELNAAGDIFTLQQFNLVTGQPYRVSFDYLGLADTASVPGDFGGYAGMSEDFPGRHLWYYGTGSNSGASDILVDDGQWHSYNYYFTAPVFFSEHGSGPGNDIRLMFEDFLESGGMVGDAYFDNISLTVVPEPATILLLCSGLIGLFSFRNKFKK
ncbi:MAG: PEP-CTERM sorting domain-containing protein [Candidatus Omnitrophota bacterium]|nr:PEP-CTERM sorting domain-containing protein [Candidatus Omnitrophota bacterium]